MQHPIRRSPAPVTAAILAVFLLFAAGLGALALSWLFSSRSAENKRDEHGSPQPSAISGSISSTPNSTSAPGQLSLLYTPWTKLCGRDPRQPNAPEECLVIKEGRLASGIFVVSAALIQNQYDSKTVLRVTLPLGMRLEPGSRIMIDQDNPLSASYSTCLSEGCIADYPGGTEFVERLKTSDHLTLQAITAAGQPISFPLSLEGFAATYAGPPTDIKSFAQQKELQIELNRRAQQMHSKTDAPAN